MEHQSVTIDLIYVGVLFLVGLGAAIGPFVLSNLLSPRAAQEKTLAPYECGVDPYGSAWDIRFNIAFYLYALIFLAFDVDVLYLFPVATAFNKVSGLQGIFEIFLFVGILSLAVIYAWVKGVFTWQKKNTPR